MRSTTFSNSCSTILGRTTLHSFCHWPPLAVRVDLIIPLCSAGTGLTLRIMEDLKDLMTVTSLKIISIGESSFYFFFSIFVVQITFHCYLPRLGRSYPVDDFHRNYILSLFSASKSLEFCPIQRILCKVLP